MAAKTSAAGAPYAAYSTAKRLARENHVTTRLAWGAFVRSRPASGKPLPIRPDVGYADKWEGWPLFLGTGTHGVSPAKYWTYAAAAKHVRSLGLQSKDEFLLYARDAKRPLEMPIAPHHVYKGKGWVGYAQFLGIPLRGRAASKLYWPYEKARDYVHAKRFKTSAEWHQWSRTDQRPVTIPRSPQLAYKGDGWVNWGDFLGAEYQRQAELNGLRRPMKLLSYTQARKIVSVQGLQSAQDFRIWARSGSRPDNVPIHPDVTYKVPVWKGWGHFLGLGNKRGLGLSTGQTVLSYKAAQSVMRELQVKTSTAYFDMLSEGTLPRGLPAQPETAYAGEGWTSWATFLGSRAKAPLTRGPKTRPDGLLAFTAARKLARSLNLGSTAAWFKYAAGPQRPVYVPKEPWKVYFLDGYLSLEDFIGLSS